MWKLIVKNKMPPTRIARYCCKELKERGGQNRFVVTGVRWEESVNRRKRASFETLTKDTKKRVMLNVDNEENRRQIERCITQGKIVLNPIIDWSTDDVWEFLEHYGCKSNPLYQCGFHRIGCIGCPMASSQEKAFEFERYPKFKVNYIKAFDRMIATRKEQDMPVDLWRTGEDVFNRWVSPAMWQSPDQLGLFDEEESV